ncbi:MAG TPA: radical SAM protein [Methanoregula sp.]|nr:radical SAM protein [Methanoregula sp.]
MGLASLAAVLKQEGHTVKVFDTAFYRDHESRSQTEIRAERMISKEVRNEDSVLPENTTDMTGDLLSLVRDFRPDLIGFSILEIMYATSIRLAGAIREEFPQIPIIAGGVFPTLSPDIVIGEPAIDIVCLGEGETSMRILADRLARREAYDDVEGLWVKRGGNIAKNRPSHLHDIDALPFPDFSEFDPRLFYKPMQGKMYKMINIESSRGCVNNCTYCAAPQLRKFFRENDCGKYNRNMTMDKVIEQIRLQVQKYSPEFVYFSSENFLAVTEEEFRQFIAAYEEIRLPFWIQTRIETLSKDRIEALKRVGMLWLTIGLEHGNEEFRRKVLKRHYSNEKFIEQMGILKEAGIGASVNNVIGFPDETRELIFDTIRMNKRLYEANPLLETNVFLFTPYRGCELFGICLGRGLVDDMLYTTSSNMNERSVLDFPEEHQKDLTGLVRTFNLYIRLPVSRYDEIRIAESPTPEGDATLKRLMDEVAKKRASKSSYA